MAGNSNGLFFRRRIMNAFTMILSLGAAAIGLFFLGWILWTTISNGLPALSIGLFTKPTADGGLANALVGSIVMCGLAVLWATPVGIAAGTYLAEYANKTRHGEVIRFVNDILLSAPSIVLGLFIYTVVVLPMDQGFTMYAGVIVLGFIILPVVVRTTDEMLRLVPTQMREAALSLGIPQWKVTTKVLYRAARSGITTGIMLGLARISGESAPLIFTNTNNQFWSFSPTTPMANLPMTIYEFSKGGIQEWIPLAWAGALLITLFVLAISLTARVILLRNRIQND